jgi:ubiquinone/menaquinone biosynthesis C-methylase UbiE
MAASAGPEHLHRLLTWAAPLLRLPSAPDRPPEVLPDGIGLRCPVTGRTRPCRDGVLDLLAAEVALTPAQRAFVSSVIASAYERCRDAIGRALGVPPFQVEVATIQQALDVQPGDTLLDVACGQGNFTAEWAALAGPQGLVLALDLSPVMLARAAARMQRGGLHNVLLIRADALRLPLANGCLAKVNCSGGFHLFPDLPQALREIARVSAPGARLTAAAFAEGPHDGRAGFKRWMKRRFGVHFVPLVWLGEQLAAVGYQDYRWSLHGGWFAYTSARKAAT